MLFVGRKRFDKHDSARHTGQKKCKGFFYLQDRALYALICAILLVPQGFTQHQHLVVNENPSSSYRCRNLTCLHVTWNIERPALAHFDPVINQTEILAQKGNSGLLKPYSHTLRWFIVNRVTFISGSVYLIPTPISNLQLNQFICSLSYVINRYLYNIFLWILNCFMIVILTGV